MTITDADVCRLPRPGKSRSDAEELKGYSSEAGAVVPDHFQVRPILQTVTGVTGAGRSADIFEGTPTGRRGRRSEVRDVSPPLFGVFGRPRYAMMSCCLPSVAPVTFRGFSDVATRSIMGISLQHWL